MNKGLRCHGAHHSCDTLGVEIRPAACGEVVMSIDQDFEEGVVKEKDELEQIRSIICDTWCPAVIGWWRSTCHVRDIGRNRGSWRRYV